MNTNNDEIIVVRNYATMAEAISAKERLEENGITCMITDLDVAGLTPTDGIELKVFAKEAERAAAILSQ